MVDYEKMLAELKCELYVLYFAV